MRFFFDNNLSPKIVKALQALQPDVQLSHLRDKFSPDTLDDVWIQALAAEGQWIIISGDVRIAKNSALRRVWLESDLVTFFLASGWMSLTIWDSAWRLIKWWPRIIDTAENFRPPASFLVSVNPPGKGKLRQISV